MRSWIRLENRIERPGPPGEVASHRVQKVRDLPPLARARLVGENLELEYRYQRLSWAMILIHRAIIRDVAQDHRRANRCSALLIHAASARLRDSTVTSSLVVLAISFACSIMVC